jgi:dolichol-phosphate mannosyltransferase
VDPAPDVSVILPTLNEAVGLGGLHDPLLASIAPYRAEVIVVDDGSGDGTIPLVERWALDGAFRLVVRSGRRGLAYAVLDGIALARGRAIVVMDADGSHEPRSIPELVDPVLEGRAEMVLGCRNVPDGSAPGMGLGRRLASGSAALLARPLTRVRDPMSGFFSVAPGVVRRAPLSPVGFKVGLEILVKCRPSPTLEVPIRFVPRSGGKSKLGATQVGEYIRHLARLYRWHATGPERSGPVELHPTASPADPSSP